MTFKQILERANKNYIPVWRLWVATEVNDYLSNAETIVDENTFEAICDFVYDWIINTSATPFEVIENLARAINENEQFEFTSESINDNWQELTEIINGMF